MESPLPMTSLFPETISRTSPRSNSPFTAKIPEGSRLPPRCRRALTAPSSMTSFPLGLENEERLIGQGISFCAVCDGAFYADKVVGVVGGGNSALQEALLLSELAKKVYVIQNLDTLTGEVALREQLMAKENVEIILGTVVDSLRGEDELRAITLKTLSNGATRTLALDGLFIAIGLVPQNEPFAKLVELDERGYVCADENCATSVPGVFVAGDSRHKRIRQVTTASADGAVAALAACDYVDSLK